MAALPDELVQLFASFARISVIGRLRQTCARWREIIQIPPLLVDTRPCLTEFSRGVERFSAIVGATLLCDEDGNLHIIYILEMGTVDLVRRVLGGAEYCILFPFTNSPENYWLSCVYDPSRDYRAGSLSMDEIAYLSMDGRTRVVDVGKIDHKLPFEGDVNVAVSHWYTWRYEDWHRDWSDCDD